MDATAFSMRAVSSSLFYNSSDSKFSFGSIHKAGPPPPLIVRCVNSGYCVKPLSRANFSCAAVAANRHNTFGSGSASASSLTAATRLQVLIEEFQSLIEPLDRVKRLLHYATQLPPFGDSLRTVENRVPGCTAQVWLHVELDGNNKLRFLADSDSEITKGFCACLIRVLDGTTPEEVLAVKTEDLGPLGVAGMNVQRGAYSSNRSNTWQNVLMSMKKRTKALVAEREGRPRGERFPSLILTADGIQAKGSYAEAQVKLDLLILYSINSY